MDTFLKGEALAFRVFQLRACWLIARLRVDVGEVGNNVRIHSTAPDASHELSTEVSEWLRAMYEDAFEAVFGSWLGNYCCPFA